MPERKKAEPKADVLNGWKGVPEPQLRSAAIESDPAFGPPVRLLRLLAVAFRGFRYAEEKVITSS